MAIEDFALMLLTGLVALFLVAVHAQDDQSGFVSIDCGLPQDANYTDAITGINYVSDAGFIGTGVISSAVSAAASQPFKTLRSFPQGTRNCYTLRPSPGKGSKYLIRAGFWYGNYDGKNQLPEFDLYLGVDYWDTVTLNSSSPSSLEIIHVLSSDFLHVCLVNTGRGTPFISTLELRNLNVTMYATTAGSLQTFARLDLGSTSTRPIRYRDDMNDREWTPYNDIANTTAISTSLDVDSTKVFNVFRPPSEVMKTAVVPENARSGLSFSWEAQNLADQFYVYMYFAEVQVLKPNQSRVFEVDLNGELWSGPFAPAYLMAYTVYSPAAEKTRLSYQVVFTQNSNSTLPPLLNAIEIYKVKLILSPQTVDQDVDAIMNVKSTYGVKRNWEGDPCIPQANMWDGLSCSPDSIGTPRIVSLNLSMSGLTGNISSDISGLTMLQTLDLSGNNLSGQVPSFLSQLTFLRVLNLKGNNFTGPLPHELLAKSKDGSLSLIVGGDDKSTSTGNTSDDKKKKKKAVAPLVASILGALTFGVLVVLLIVWMVRRRKQQGPIAKIESQRMLGKEVALELELKSQQFTYSSILKMTNNLKTILGKGGFGTVYLGYKGDCPIAVKMLSPSSVQGYKEFQAEASLLVNVHHKNLTSLVGYCMDGHNLGIIYEYMANGNLANHLSEKSSQNLSWKKRLQIAYDAAQGLEYLHHGCTPPIVHRDIKCTNILLDDNFRAKLADFGLSRIFPVDGSTHVTTVVAGTRGYLDPEYYKSSRLTEKSDVYSFGVVLLEIITGRRALGENDYIHVSKWVSGMLDKGGIGLVVDSRLRGDFNADCAWRGVEVAIACVSPQPTKRPTMTFVVSELKECLMEMMNPPVVQSEDSTRMMSLNLHSSLNPIPR
ncbi:probable LRR receptor-like serine/threonine-protein kinase At1g05700 [Ipomoea triloba]|uniref:probable LRR receptor-like serine/threonine-protein kinase At1g05700 n=1 Tax=Ipomoea triloba TaxID=35885 RepID=UPI00125DB5FB|nr:probable LRR receptor-like serine/threonine-protein kinase At1g05700 [Ipomoea triloba]